MRAQTLLALSALMTLLAGCGGGDGSNAGGGTDGPCGEATRKQWVLNVAREWYLFPDLLPASTDIAAYSTAEDLLDALTATARAQGKDRFFSYLTTKSAEDSLLGEGQFVGFGFRSRTDTGNRPFVLDVFEGSPAATAGAAARRRGHRRRPGQWLRAGCAVAGGRLHHVHRPAWRR